MTLEGVAKQKLRMGSQEWSTMADGIFLKDLRFSDAYFLIECISIFLH